jgi:hypothetical protein
VITKDKFLAKDTYRIGVRNLHDHAPGPFSLG